MSENKTEKLIWFLIVFLLVSIPVAAFKLVRGIANKLIDGLSSGAKK
jgi:hypothetical protein